MAHRLTRTEKWQDPWFRKLKAGEKLVFLYLIDNCNLAGFYEMDVDMMAFQIGIGKDKIPGAMKGLDKAVIQIDQWIWIKNFIRHQKNLPLNPNNKAHRHIIGLLEEKKEQFEKCNEYTQILGACKPLTSPTGIGIGIGKGKGTGNSKQPKRIDRPVNAQEVIDFFKQKGYPRNLAIKAYDYYESNGWHDANGKPILAWKQKMISNWLNPENKNMVEEVERATTRRTIQ